MLGVDTNILLRFFIHDTPEQSAKVLEYFKKNLSSECPAFVTSVTLAEFVWTLRSLYKYPKHQIAELLYNMLSSSEIFVEHQEEATKALNDFRNGNADFADYYTAHINHKYGSGKVITFDKKAATHHLFELIK